MILTTFKTGIGLFTLLALSACATQERSEPLADDTMQCAPTETLACDRFSGENYNCRCERGDDLKKMLDAYDMAKP